MPENAHALTTLTSALSTAIAAGVLLLGCGAASALAAPSTVTFATPGEYPIVIPAGVTNLHVVAVGGRGGEGTYAVPGGLGARVTATLAVTAGTTRYLMVGGDGQTGINHAGAGGGGGASDVRTAPASAGVTPTDPRILIAGGGGGSGSGYWASGGLPTAGPGGAAGAAGGNSRESNYPNDIESGGGAAGVPAGTGAGGTSGAVDSWGAAGVAGARGQGGDGAYVDVFRGVTEGGFNGGGRGGGGAETGPFGNVTYKGGGGGGGGLNGGGGGGGIAIVDGRSALNAEGGAGGGGGTSLVPIGGSVVTDTVGAGGSITVSFEDATAPTLQLAAPPARVGGTVTVTGTSGTVLGDGAVTVELYAGPAVAGVPVTKTATRNAGTGAYTASFAGLGQGPYTVRATQIDGAGNVGVSTTRTVVSDTIAPTLSLTSPAGGGVTNDPTPSFAGVAGTAAGDEPTVQVEVRNAQNALVQTVSTQRDGTTGAFAAAATTPLSDGTYTAVAKQSDDVGNPRTTSAVTFRVDATGPAVALTSGPAARTNDASPAIGGTAGTAAGDAPTVDVRIFPGTSASGAPVASFEAAVDGSGKFVARAAGLADGTYTTTVAQTDSAGNSGTSAPATFTVDTAAPAVTLAAPSAGAKPVFTGVGGTAQGDGATVTVTVHAGGALVQTIAATRDPATGAYSATAPFALADGTYTAVATQADDVGNTGTTAARAFTVGAPAPGGPAPGGVVPGGPAPGGVVPGGVVPGGVVPGGAVPGASDTVAPVLSRVSLSAARFRVGKARTAVMAAKALRRGTTVRFTLSEDATVKLAITRKGRSKVITTLTRRAKKGASRVAFSGRIAKKALTSGRYVLTLTATDAAGNRGAAKKLGFRIG